MIDNPFLSLLTVSIYVLSCYGIGLLTWSITSLYKLEPFKNPNAANIATHFLVGTSVMSFFLTIAGLIGLIVPSFLILILFIGICTLYYKRHYCALILSLTLTHIHSWKNESNFIKIIFTLNIIMALAYAVAAWTFPPIGDAEAFYLVYPKIIAATGWIEPMHGSYYAFSTISLPAELHFASLMVLSDPAAAKLFVFPISIAAIIMLCELIKLCGGNRVACTLACAITLSSTAYNHHIFDGKTDMFAATFGLATIYWLIKSTITERNSAYYVISGIFAGLATLAKFSYIPTLGISVLLITVWQHFSRNTSFRQALLNSSQLFYIFSILGIFALLPWIPQLIKNALLFNAPLAPFIGAETTSGWLKQVWFSDETTRHIIKTYPLALIYGRYPMQGGDMSFLMLAFMPFIFLTPKLNSWRHSILSTVTISGLCAVILWIALMPSIIAPRYILSSLLLLIPIVAISTENALSLTRNHSMLKLTILGATTFALIASAWHITPIKKLLSNNAIQPSHCTIASNYCEAVNLINVDAKPSDRIFFAGYYSYWLNANQLQCRDSNKEYDQISHESNMLSWLTQRGFRYIIVDSDSHDWLNKKIIQTDSSKEFILSVQAFKSVTVYKLKRTTQPETSCVKAQDSKWYIREHLNHDFSH
jgi:hypothetical protein